jgi:hypothetical protein
MKEFQDQGKANSLPERTRISAKCAGSKLFSLLLIQDVYPGSGIQNPNFSIPEDQKGNLSQICNKEFTYF